MNNQKKIMVCEDEETTLIILEDLLSSEGYQVLTATNGLEGLEVLNKNDDIEVIVCDWMMPEMDGLDLLKILNKNERLKNIPFIMLTGKNKKNKNCWQKSMALSAISSNHMTKIFS